MVTVLESNSVTNQVPGTFPLRTYAVLPVLPERLKPLREIAFNLWWTWNLDAIELFRRMDQGLWTRLHHNPVAVLSDIGQDQLLSLVHNDGFLAHMDRVSANLKKYLELTTWYQTSYGQRSGCIAYFSSEFGIHESLANYSGGLGVLSGDHLKSASELGLPLVGVSLFYRLGYFQQQLNSDGWQQENYPENDCSRLALVLEREAKGQPVLGTVEYPAGPVRFQIWKAVVGRVALYLMDTNIAENRPEDRIITGQLYGGDREHRLRQEILLGVGGVRALRALGITPAVFHMNEGHSAFLAVERVRLLMQEAKISFAQARQAVTASSVFTNHTPVPAGNDAFDPNLVDRYFKAVYPQLGLSREEFLGLGRLHPEKPDEFFGMTVLALRLAAFRNGVSELHGAVCRKMWREMWPGVPEGDVPISAIVNGVHVRSWLADEMETLYNRYLDPRWVEDPVDQEPWKRVDQIPDAELWRSHERLRERLVTFARRRLKEQLRQRGATQAELTEAENVLDPECLTIGFARRFATYKRATLLLRDKERLLRLLNHPDQPVQFVFAGKAHPQDNEGKELIRIIIHLARDERVRRRLVFLENYDMNIARHLVQGVDVWLNTPRRPMEASGTSGMKVPVNGGLNVSILDGWWDEAYDPEFPDNGWAIGKGEEYANLDYQDEIEGRALYDLLEQHLVPMFYERDQSGLPRKWIGRMKASIRTICPVFNTNRMVQEYLERAYLPCLDQWESLTRDNLAGARELADWEQMLRASWPRLQVEEVVAEIPPRGKLEVGMKFPVTARLYLGDLPPHYLSVDCYYGPLDSQDRLESAEAVRLAPEPLDPGRFLFRGFLPCRRSGRHGFALRILPAHPLLTTPYDLRLIRWG